MVSQTTIASERDTSACAAQLKSLTERLTYHDTNANCATYHACVRNRSDTHGSLNKLLAKPLPIPGPIAQTGDCTKDTAVCEGELARYTTQLKACQERASCRNTRDNLLEALKRKGVVEVQGVQSLDSEDCAVDTKRCEADVARLRELLGDCASLAECNQSRVDVYDQMKQLAAVLRVELVPHRDIDIQTTCDAALQVCTADKKRMEGILQEIDEVLAKD